MNQAMAEQPLDILDEIAEISKAMESSSSGGHSGVQQQVAPEQGASGEFNTFPSQHNGVAGPMVEGTKPFVPRKSPRRIQDMLIDFDAAAALAPAAEQTVSEPFNDYQSHAFSTNEVTPNVVDSLCAYSQDGNVHDMNPLSSNNFDFKSSANCNPPSVSTSSPVSFLSHSVSPFVVVPKSMYKNNQITPWLENSASDCGTVPETMADIEAKAEPVSAPTFVKDNQPQMMTGNASFLQQASKKSSGVSKPSRSSAPLSPIGSSKVMPPTAKSILERRERAIREGRRHEARLNDEERRILRRLRNRESAERCARRKMQQASSLSMKIAELEAENLRLRKIAAQCSSEVLALESFISTRSKR